MDVHQIQQVRRFNRVITQRVGMLEETYLRRGRPLAEARVIFETGPHGADVRGLRDRLALDSGYLSRLLRSLEAQGLVVVHKHPGDGRQRRVSLTQAGQAEFLTYDRLSDELAESMLAPLGATQRDRLLTAMAEVERLIRSGAVQVQIEAPDSQDARWCLAEYVRELDQRFEGGFDPARNDPLQDTLIRPPAGYFVVARLEGSPVGCAALRREDEATGEIKRMWTAPSARGQGVARAMLQFLENTARELGLKVIRLDTHQALREAQTLYRKVGFKEVGRFNNNPYAHHWFAKTL